MNKRQILRSINFGHRVAEDETDLLSTYFVDTDQWIRLHNGEIDIVYGPKGSGKSALYSLLLSRSTELFDRNILLIAGENPRGAPAFRDLEANPPAEQLEFVGLWKLFIASLLHGALTEYGVRNRHSIKLEEALAREGLIRGRLSLAGLLRAVGDYTRRMFRPQAIEGNVSLDPTSMMPSGVGGKIVFSEPSSGDSFKGFNSVTQLLEYADAALASAGYSSWVLFDRLDTAFAENADLERNALRALFVAYLDMLSFDSIKLKIFLRVDIWNRITSSGFREASHITRHVTIDWNRSSLLNLIVRRVLHNDIIRQSFGVDLDLAKQSVDAQEEFLYRLVPDQVDVGPNKPNTLDWMLSRTRDGLKLNAPRELIHLLNSIRDVQARRLEVGEDMPEGDLLFTRSSFKAALPEISKIRLEQTLYAEYPNQRDWLERLRGEKTLQTPRTLSAIWGISTDEAVVRARELEIIGFFEARGTKQSPEYWIPFLYRDALSLVQGAAE